ncbi:unnamed protein product [Soboliphyme baturini]|uniref:Uncharacterized protein n=1 Tax=Soboliphyme baturini TaxID=241478 RepID=A0A183IN53_9BILA|nr:unnamed protein product [Soboliphyme baturini]
MAEAEEVVSPRTEAEKETPHLPLPPGSLTDAKRTAVEADGVGRQYGTQEQHIETQQHFDNDDVRRRPTTDSGGAVRRWATATKFLRSTAASLAGSEYNDEFQSAMTTTRYSLMVNARQCESRMNDWADAFLIAAERSIDGGMFPSTVSGCVTRRGVR